MAGHHLSAYILSLKASTFDAADATAVETQQTLVMMVIEGAPQCCTPALPFLSRFQQYLIFIDNPSSSLGHSF
jgi:hypothetical protein